MCDQGLRQSLDVSVMRQTAEGDKQVNVIEVFSTSCLEYRT